MCRSEAPGSSILTGSRPVYLCSRYLSRRPPNGRLHMDLGEGTPDERWERVYAKVQRLVAAEATCNWRAPAASRGHGRPPNGYAS